jgi:hypothetical protein
LPTRAAMIYLPPVATPASKPPSLMVTESALPLWEIMLVVIIVH